MSLHLNPSRFVNSDLKITMPSLRRHFPANPPLSLGGHLPKESCKDQRDGGSTHLVPARTRRSVNRDLKITMPSLCGSFSGNEPLIIGHICGKRPAKRKELYQFTPCSSANESAC